MNRCPILKCDCDDERCDVGDCVAAERMSERDDCAIQLEFLAECLPDGTARRELIHAAQSLRATIEFQAYQEMRAEEGTDG